MEISVSGRQRRTAQAAKTAPRMGKTSQAAEKSAFGRPRTDRANWSRQALSFLQEVNRQDLENRRKQLEAKQRKSGDLDALSKSLEVMEKCQKIAARIMRGDKVPPQDEQFLMERDPDGYKLAIVCREPKENPKEWESVLKGEEESGSSEGAESGGEETVDSGAEAAE